MDVFSHGLWGYAALHRDAGLRRWGALAGALPDLLWFVPTAIERASTRGWSAIAIGGDRSIWRADGPPLPPDLVTAYFKYYVYTHSLVLLSVVTAVVLLTRWRRLAWLAIPYALHIAMDIPTHERYQTRPFHPLSDWNLLAQRCGARDRVRVDAETQTSRACVTRAPSRLRCCLRH
jgi:hypothetical protein